MRTDFPEELKTNIARFIEMSTKLGGLFTQAQASRLTGLTKQRVRQLVEDGRLRLHSFEISRHGRQVEMASYVTGDDLHAYLAAGRKKRGRKPGLGFDADEMRQRRAAATRQWRLDNPERYKAYQRTYRQRMKTS